MFQLNRRDAQIHRQILVVVHGHCGHHVYGLVNLKKKITGNFRAELNLTFELSVEDASFTHKIVVKTAAEMSTIPIPPPRYGRGLEQWRPPIGPFRPMGDAPFPQSSFHDSPRVDAISSAQTKLPCIDEFSNGFCTTFSLC